MSVEECVTCRGTGDEVETAAPLLDSDGYHYCRDCGGLGVRLVDVEAAR